MTNATPAIGRAVALRLARDSADMPLLPREVGDIDILINNAGIALFAPTAELEVAAFDTIFARNVRAQFFLVAAFARRMAARGHGSTVSVSSMAGGRPPEDRGRPPRDRHEVL